MTFCTNYEYCLYTLKTMTSLFSWSPLTDLPVISGPFLTLPHCWNPSSTSKLINCSLSLYLWLFKMLITFSLINSCGFLPPTSLSFLGSQTNHPQARFHFSLLFLKFRCSQNLSLSFPSSCCPDFPDDLTLGLQLELTDILTHSETCIGRSQRYCRF